MFISLLNNLILVGGEVRWLFIFSNFICLIVHLFSPWTWKKWLSIYIPFMDIIICQQHLKTFYNLFNAHKTLLGHIVLLFPFYRLESQGRDKINSLFRKWLWIHTININQYTFQPPITYWMIPFKGHIILLLKSPVATHYS